MSAFDFWASFFRKKLFTSCVCCCCLNCVVALSCLLFVMFLRWAANATLYNLVWHRVWHSLVCFACCLSNDDIYWPTATSGKVCGDGLWTKRGRMIYICITNCRRSGTKTVRANTSSNREWPKGDRDALAWRELRERSASMVRPSKGQPPRLAHAINCGQ